MKDRVGERALLTCGASIFGSRNTHRHLTDENRASTTILERREFLPPKTRNRAASTYAHVDTAAKSLARFIQDQFIM